MITGSPTRFLFLSLSFLAPNTADRIRLAHNRERAHSILPTGPPAGVPKAEVRCARRHSQSVLYL